MIKKTVRALLGHWGLAAVLLMASALAPIGLAVAAGAITSLDIVDGQVKTVDLGKNAVTWRKIKPGAVKTSRIANGAVTGAKLNVAGSSVRAAGFNYAAPKTGYLSLPGIAFRPEDSSATFGTLNFSIYAKGSPSAVIFVAPVNLPQDAIITGMTYQVSDTDPGPNSWAKIYRMNSGTVETVVDKVWSSGSSGWQNVSTSAILLPTVDNSTYTYFAEFMLTADLTNLKADKLLITYSYVSPGS